MTLIIHFTSKSMGSLDWELPEQVEVALSKVSQAERDLVFALLKELLQADICTLVSVATYREPAKALDYLNDNGMDLLLKLKERFPTLS